MNTLTLEGSTLIKGWTKSSKTFYMPNWCRDVNPWHLFPKNPSPIKSYYSLHHSHPSFIKPHLPHHSNSNHFPPKPTHTWPNTLSSLPINTPPYHLHLSHNIHTPSLLLGRKQKPFPFPSFLLLLLSSFFFCSRTSKPFTFGVVKALLFVFP